MVKTKSVWACSECGHTQMKWTGSCPACQRWNTLAEEVETVEPETRFETKPLAAARPMRVSEVAGKDFPRITTKIKEFDRLLGGGIVSGSLTLIGGDPGVGKSTLLLQISQSLAAQGLVVLYVCGEESVEQTSLRARRLKAVSENLLLLSETNFSHIKRHIDAVKPDILIVDSIQIVFKSELPSAPGSVSQVRELAGEFMRVAKGLGIATFLIGHVTKSGEIAGPKVLEHIVDTVLDFEGDRQAGYRMLRAVKNRFGPTDDIALFQMFVEGLREVENPSEAFLQERMKESCGSVVIPTIEGSRAILIEVQALAAASAFATSTRRSAGLDQNRLALLLAVLEKKMGYALHHTDVFVSVAGGMKIVEPAIDLGILIAIASSFCNKAVHPAAVVMGEVGLGGEVRSVPRAESRIKEALNLGFKKCILPKKSLKSISRSYLDQIELFGVEKVEEAIRALLG